MIPSPVPISEDLCIHPGPALLADPQVGRTQTAHRERYGQLPALDLPQLMELVESAGLRGRGGAAFPFAVKLRTVAERRRRPVVVVNLSEGEPASAKDSALVQTRPHLVLDGAVAAARALGSREVHVVLPGDRPRTAAAMLAALRERKDDVELRHHHASARFVAGQARAVIELIEGRPNLPTTSWAPEAVAGVRGRPTLLSNAETWAHVGLLALRGASAYQEHGTVDEPGTTLLTISAPGQRPEIHEVEYGTRLRDLLPDTAIGGPALIGGFHGSWVTWETLTQVRVSVPGMRELGLALGAGVVHTVGPQRCTLDLTSRIVDYLAQQSAGRCGPCFNGLPALALAVREALAGVDARERIEQLAATVERRGACAHPDGTVRLVRSLFTMLPMEMAAHSVGSCTGLRSGGPVPAGRALTLAGAAS